MLQSIPLAPIPNQSLSVNIDNNFYEISLKFTPTILFADISRNNVALVRGARVVSFVPLINYQYLEEGNFFLATLNQALPDYTQFGISQGLYYLPQFQLDAIRALR